MTETCAGCTADGNAEGSINTRTDVWTVPCRRTVATKAAHRTGPAAVCAGTAPRGHTAPAAGGHAGASNPEAMSREASSSLATEREERDPASPEQLRPRKRGRPPRSPQQGDDGASERQYRGVKWLRRREQWSAFITFEGDLQPLGTFDTAEAAARAYDWAALDLYGRRALLNFSRSRPACGHAWLAT